jgi:hypothetical protein
VLAYTTSTIRATVSCQDVEEEVVMIIVLTIAMAAVVEAVGALLHHFSEYKAAYMKLDNGQIDESLTHTKHDSFFLQELVALAVVEEEAAEVVDEEFPVEQAGEAAVAPVEEDRVDPISPESSLW